MPSIVTPLSMGFASLEIKNSMKKIFTIIIATIFYNLIVAQSAEKVNLQWKLEDDETIVYKTLMNEIDTSSFEFDLGNLFDVLGDSVSSESKNMLNKIQKSFNEIDLVTTLTSDKEAVKIEMKTVDQEKIKKKKKNDDEIDIQKLMSSLNDGVVLRGSVFKSGGIESFWIKTNQKNLIALFFELPKEEIEIGDTWNIEVNFIGNDQNFDCDSSYRKNEVTLVDLKIVEGDTVAVLKYDIQEFVTGDFNSPFSGGGTKTIMLMTHFAVGEFSLTKGRWVTYDGIMSLIASGVMTSNTRKSFSLVTIK